MNRSAIVAALAAAALLGSTPPALAAPPRHSSIFAGYEVSKPTAHLRNVTATFVVPRITCEHEFGGVGPAVLVYSHVNPRTGAHRTSGGGVGVACEDGNAFYESVFIVNDRTVQQGLVGFSPGDVVVVSVTVTRAHTSVSIDDRTAGTSMSHGGAGHVASQTFVGDSSVTVNGVSGELNPFSKTHATGVRIDGRPLAKNHPHRYVWARDGKTLVTASALTAGENFTLTFRSGG
ncbi:MAG TPA: G1 family glutamic endopeptidase [Mycobacteriales bacterium]|nr:G1 family glutamic endopeptidase [Mycobacteriales bacterium]